MKSHNHFKFTIVFLLLVTATILLSTSCKKEVEPQLPSQPKKLEVIWKTLIAPDSIGYSSISMNPVLYNDEVVVNSEYTINGINAPVLFLDSTYGSIKRTYTGLAGGPYDGFQIAHSSDYLLFGEQTSVDCLNLVTGTKQWSGAVSDERPYIYESNGYVYRGFPYGYENGQHNSSRLKRTQAGSNAWETVYDFTRTDNYRPGFIGCGFGTLPNGDEVVVWKNWSVTPSNSERTDIFAYNLTADSLLWRNTDFKESGTVQPLKVVDGVVYGLISRSAIAVDLLTGITFWR